MSSTRRAAARHTPVARVATDYVTAGAIAGGATALADYLAGGRALGGIATLEVTGLGIAYGAVLGLALGAVAALLCRTARRTAALAWGLVMLACAALLVLELDAIAKIGTRNHGLAVATLVGALTGAALGTALIAAVQPSAEVLGADGAGRWLESVPAGASPRRRAALGAGLAAALAACTWADRTLLTGSYPAFHAALELAGVLTVLIALLLVPLPRVACRRARLGAAAVAIALSALPFVTLEEADRATIAAAHRRPYARLALEAMRTAVDFDRDGHASVLGGGDCAAFDAARHPGAREVPNNGVDDNCRFGDGSARARRAPDPASVPIPSEPSPLSVVLVTVDTLRADHVGLYGYGRNTTPHIDAHFKDAARFEAAYTSGGYTSIAAPSMLRGIYPRHVRWSRVVQTSHLRLFRPPIDEPLRPGERIIYHYTLPLDDPRSPLAWWLQRRGMRTVAVVNDGVSDFLSARWTTDRGFDGFVEIETQGHDPRGDAKTADAAVREIGELDPDAPFFLWVHFYGPHAPDARHPGVPSFGEGTAGAYDHEIAYADRQVGRVLDALANKMGERDYALMLTSDHGERLGPRGVRWHGRDMKPPSIRIPMLVRAPGLAPAAHPEVVSLVDVLPSVLAWTRTPAPPGLDGHPLGQTPPDRVAFVDTWVRGPRDQVQLDLVAGLDAGHRFVFDRRFNVASLFRRGADDPENLIAEGGAPELEEAVYRYLEGTYATGGNKSE